MLAGGGAAAHMPLVFAGFILFNLAMNAGPNATTFTLAPELFPTARPRIGERLCRGHRQGRARRSASSCCRRSRDPGASPAVLALMAVVSALGAIITAVLARQVREIPEGRGLDETTAGPA